MIKKKLLTLTILSSMAIMSLTGCTNPLDKGNEETTQTTAASSDTTTETTAETTTTSETATNIPIESGITTEASTESQATTDVVKHATSVAAITAYFNGIAHANGDEIKSAFPPLSDVTSVVESTLAVAQSAQANTIFHTDALEFTQKGDASAIASNFNIPEGTPTEYYSIVVPMDRIVDGNTYKVRETYEAYTVYMTDSWYMFKIESLGTESYDANGNLVESTGSITTTETPNTGATTEAPNTSTTPTGTTTSNYSDYNNLTFSVDGKSYRVGHTTVQDMINGGVPFKQEDTVMFSNMLAANQNSSPISIELGEHNTANIIVRNTSSETKKLSDCIVYTISYSPLSNKDRPGMDRIQFGCPLTLTETELKNVTGEPTEFYTLNSEFEPNMTTTTYEYYDTTALELYPSKIKYEFINGELSILTYYSVK